MGKKQKREYLAIRSSDGKPFAIGPVAGADEAYVVFGRQICGMQDPIDTGNVDIDLYELPYDSVGNQEAQVVELPVAK